MRSGNGIKSTNTVAIMQRTSITQQILGPRQSHVYNMLRTNVPLAVHNWAFSPKQSQLMALLWLRQTILRIMMLI